MVIHLRIWRYSQNITTAEVTVETDDMSFMCSAGERKSLEFSVPLIPRSAD